MKSLRIILIILYLALYFILFAWSEVPEIPSPQIDYGTPSVVEPNMPIGQDQVWEENPPLPAVQHLVIIWIFVLCGFLNFLAYGVDRTKANSQPVKLPISTHDMAYALGRLHSAPVSLCTRNRLKRLTSPGIIVRPKKFVLHSTISYTASSHAIYSLRYRTSCPRHSRANRAFKRIPLQGIVRRDTIICTQVRYDCFVVSSLDGNWFCCEKIVIRTDFVFDAYYYKSVF